MSVFGIAVIYESFEVLPAIKLPVQTWSLTILLLVSYKSTACFLPKRFRLDLCMDTQTIHHGRNVKRIREMLGIKQDVLATSLGLSQQAISQLERKEMLDANVLEKVSKVLGVSEEAIKNFTEEAAVTIIHSTLHDNSGSVNYFPTFNPVDKWLEVIDENKRLYERLIQAEREKNELLQKLLNSRD